MLGDQVNLVQDYQYSYISIMSLLVRIGNDLQSRLLSKTHMILTTLSIDATIKLFASSFPTIPTNEDSPVGSRPPLPT